MDVSRNPVCETSRGKPALEAPRSTGRLEWHSCLHAVWRYLPPATGPGIIRQRERGLPLPERLDAGQNADRETTRDGMDLRRRFHNGLRFRSAVQRCQPHEARRHRRHHQLPGWDVRVHGAPATFAGIRAPQLGQLRIDGHDPGAQMGQDEHQRIWRRPRPRDGVRPIQGRSRYSISS